MREPGEPRAVEIDGQRLVGGAKGVDPHIELPAAEEERVEQVALADVGLGRVLLVERLPLGDVCDLVEDEYASALTLGGLSG